MRITKSLAAYSLQHMGGYPPPAHRCGLPPPYCTNFVGLNYYKRAKQQPGKAEP